jgi:hypothetical protein
VKQRIWWQQDTGRPKSMKQGELALVSWSYLQNGSSAAQSDGRELMRDYSLCQNLQKEVSKSQNSGSVMQLVIVV